MIIKKQKIIRHLTTSVIVLFAGVHVISAATTSNVNSSFTIRQPEHPLQPVLYNMPTESECQTTMNVEGRAESNVEIYLNGEPQLMSSSEDGSFQLTLFFENGTNIFEIKAKRDGDFSNPQIYTIKNNACGIKGSYSQRLKKDTQEVTVNQVANHLKIHKTDEYIENTLHIIDENIEPLNITENYSNNVNPFQDAVDLGIKHTYDDMDNDGISDLTEEILGLNINSKDSDSDGVPDIEEITIGKKTNGVDYNLQVNITDGQTFECKSLLLNGNLEDKSSEPVSEKNIEFCLKGGNGSQCFDILTEKDGSFFEMLEPKIKNGDYQAQFKIEDEIIKESPVTCSPANITGEVTLSQIDFQKIYEDVDGRAVKKVQLYSMKPQPIVKGISSNHDLVFGFWIQDDKKIAKSIAFSDVNGVFETKPNRKLEAPFGFGKASLHVYGLNDGVFGSVDTINFYIFDLFMIALEIVVCILIISISKILYGKLHFKKSKINFKRKN